MDAVRSLSVWSEEGASSISAMGLRGGRRPHMVPSSPGCYYASVGRTRLLGKYG